MRRLGAALPVALLAMGAWACSLFTSLDGLTGGSDAGAIIDGSAASDAPSDVAQQEASITCDAGLSACGNSCVDVTIDVRNCGACGHDCLGGGCVDTKCQPTVIASAQNGAYDIAVGGGEAYWVNQYSGEIAKCSTSNCLATITVLATGRPAPEDIVIDDTNVYWSEQGGVASCARAGCSQLPTALVSGRTLADGGALGFDGIAVGPSLVYFPMGSAILGCNKGGCANAPATLTTSSADDLTTDAINLYGADGDDVFKCPLGNCTDATRTQLVAGVAGSEAIAVDSINAYFTYNGTVGSCSLSGCSAPTVLASNLAGPNDIATDGVNVFWTDATDNTVQRCAVGGCGGTPTILAKNQNQPKGIAVDGTAVYWTQVSGAVVMRLAK